MINAGVESPGTLHEVDRYRSSVRTAGPAAVAIRHHRRGVRGRPASCSYLPARLPVRGARDSRISAVTGFTASSGWM